MRNRVLRVCSVSLLFVVAASLGAETPEEVAWREIEHGLHDGNPLKRAQAAIAMGVLRPLAHPVELLVEALADKDSGVREAACAALSQMKAVTSIPQLEKALSDSSPEVVFAAAKALYAMGNASGREVLLAVLEGEQKDSSGFVSSSIRDARMKIHDPKAILLIGVNTGAGMLGPFGMAMPLAEGLMKDSQASGKTAAALLLATDTSPESLGALKEALGDKNWTVRAAAARSIAMRDAVSLFDDVAALLMDKRDEVEYSASACVIRLKQRVPAPAKGKRSKIKQ